MMALIELSTPKGAPWEFLIIFGTLLLGPVISRRARIPGLIGLLVGGFVIGPHGLDLIGSGNSTVPDLGQLGLLYLMFVAGLELDLNLLSEQRRSAIVFGLLTFAFPMAFGVIVGVGLGWETLPALLLGSLLASHTLISYPAIKEAGLVGDPAVATAVGSTVLTDTLALIVLAAVAGSVNGSHSTPEIALQLVVGLLALICFSLLVLPLLAGWAFRWLGAERPVRYVVAITSFLAAATVAELFGIEGIVGAFFAGLALNRLVPNEGELMDRIEFFGGAVLIPVFLVSVGLLLNPAVMVRPETLGLAGLFIVACLFGKAVAAAISARLFGYSVAQAGLLYSLSVAQAAATLAVTVVGFQLGLFDTAVVNAVLVLILVSVLVSTFVGARASANVPVRDGPRSLGTRVVVGTDDPELALAPLTIARRIARADGGVVHPVLVVSESAPFAPRAAKARFAEVVAASGVDGTPTTIVDRSVLHGAIRAGRAHDATLVLVAEPPADHLSPSFSPSAGEHPTDSPPVAVVRGAAERLGVVRTRLDGPDQDELSLAAEMARRVAGRTAQQLDDDDRTPWSEVVEPGDVTFATSELLDPLSTVATDGIVVAMVADWVVADELAVGFSPASPVPAPRREERR